jgi:hypothetical protein
MSVEPTYILDVGSIAGVVLSLLVIIVAGLLDDYYSSSKSLRISAIIIGLSAFITSNIVYSINGMRVVVSMIFLFGIFPISTGCISAWFRTSVEDLNRIQYAVFIAWFFTLVITLVLRLALGWGQLSVAGVFASVIVLSFIMCGMTSIVSIYLLKKLRNYRPRR